MIVEKILILAGRKYLVSHKNTISLRKGAREQRDNYIESEFWHYERYLLRDTPYE